MNWFENRGLRGKPTINLPAATSAATHKISATDSMTGTVNVLQSLVAWFCI